MASSTNRNATLPRPLRPAQRRELWYLLGFALLLLGIGLGLRDPWPSDEPRFVLVARWMVEHGQWLFPHRGHELYSDKPPLFMWLEALAYLVTRSWRVAFLLPSLLSGLMCVLLVYDLGRRLWNHRSGLMAALLMLVTIHFTYQFRNAQIDPLLVAWVTLANYGLLRHVLLGPNWRWYAAGCLFAGVGVITKGVGVLALLMLVPYAVARWRGWNHLAVPTGAWRWVSGLVLFFLPILAWLLPVLWAAHSSGDPEHAAYVKDILFGQTVHRYAAPSGHFHNPLYFVGIILFDWLPLSLALPWAIPAWWRRLKRRDARYLLPLAWAVLIVLFFSLSPGKRDVYILPALPMTVLAMAPLLSGLLRLRGLRWLLLTLTMALSGALLMTAVAGLFLQPDWTQRLEARLVPGIWWLLLAIGAAGLLAVALTRVRRAPLGWLLFVAALWSLYGLWGYPLLNGERSARNVMAEARALAGPGVTLGLVAWKEQNLLQAQGPVTEFGFLKPWALQYTEAVAWLRADPQHRRLFMLQEVMGDCVRHERASRLELASRRQWWLVPASAVVAGCVPVRVREDDAE